jgi:cytochrome bd-type quinol oxidase subunit 2
MRAVPPRPCRRAAWPRAPAAPGDTRTASVPLSRRRARGHRPSWPRSIGPAWEANHVWLILTFVVLRTSFPEAYASITPTLFVPLMIAALGIVLRGASFAFRTAIVRPQPSHLRGGVRPPLGAGPLLQASNCRRDRLGKSAYRRPGADLVDSWINPTSVIGGVLAVATAAYLSAVYLVWGPTPERDGSISSTVARIGRRRTRGRPARAATHPTEVMPSRLISGKDDPSDDPPEELQ